MSLPHLGDQVAALADAQLTGTARDRALSHVAVCPVCRADVEQHRALKVRVHRMVAPPAPSALTDRLLALSALSSLSDAGPAPVLAAPAPPVVPLPVVPLARPASAAFAAPPVRTWVAPARSLLAGAFALAALGGGVVVAARSGGSTPGGGDGRLVNPGVYLVAEHDRTSRETVLQDPSRMLVAAVTGP